MKKIIRNAAAYNNMLAEIKTIAAEGITSYAIKEHRNNTLYGGTECYDMYYSGVECTAGKFFAWEHYNTIGTISSEGNLWEEEIPSISKDFMLRKIKSALKEAFSAPEFVGNNSDCQSYDEWYKNQRLVPSDVTIEINNNRWVVYFQD